MPQKTYSILLSLIIVLIFSNLSYSQIRVSKHIQNTTQENTVQKSLFLIDFWATWCVPCAHVSKYLEYMQQFGPKSLHIVSLSQENEALVAAHIEKHPSKLAVAIDFEGETFRKYKVHSLPYGVLLDANGKKLWEGNPAELSMEDIKRWHSKTHKTIAIERFIKQTDLNTLNDDPIVSYAPQDKIEVKKLSGKQALFSYQKHSDYTQLKGPLRTIFAYLLHCSDKQIVLPKEAEGEYEVYIKNAKKSAYETAKAIGKKLHLKLKTNSKSMPGYIISLETPYGSRFWNTQQIQWDAGTPDFLIDDNQLSANDVGFGEVLFQLARLFEQPVLLDPNTPYDVYKQHDWQFHHHFFNLMQTDLHDNYGIKIEKKAHLETAEYLFM